MTLHVFHGSHPPHGVISVYALWWEITVVMATVSIPGHTWYPDGERAYPGTDQEQLV